MTKMTQKPSYLHRFQPLSRLLGVGLFVGMMTVGYYYNLTFVQLGLVDLGERYLGMSKLLISVQMSLLAVLTCIIAVIFGSWLSRWQKGLVYKIRVSFGVILLQTVLTYIAPNLRSSEAFTVWIILCSLALGIGVPVTFGMAVDLVPCRWRGRVAALITASAYLAANLIPASWTIENFSAPLLWLMPAGAIAMGVLAFLPLPFIQTLANQHELPEFGQGRYARRANRRLISLIVIMFGIFFVDSLGFLRLIEVPRFMEGAWQSDTLAPRFFIGVVHVVTAFIGGVLYDALDVQEMFYWVYGIFALTHLMYTLSIRTSGTNAPLAIPMLYATAVSLYTVVNFALWADLSTTQTIGRNVALGVAVSGWTATFISTALAIVWQTAGVSLERHINIVDTLAILFFLALVFRAVFLKQREPFTGGLT